MAKGECNFIKFVVLPYWKMMNWYFDHELDIAVENLDIN